MKHAVAEKILEKIEEQNLSVQGLEKKAGLKINVVRNILSGHSLKPNIDILIAVAKALGCTVNDLVSESEDQLSNQKDKIVMFTNMELLQSTMSYLGDQIKAGKEINSLALFDAIQEIYTFSENNNKITCDEGFAKWYLDRMDIL